MGDFECSECGATFDNAEELADHIKEDHTEGGEEAAFQCKKCGEQFSTKEELAEHMDENHSGPDES